MHFCNECIKMHSCNKCIQMHFYHKCIQIAREVSINFLSVLSTVKVFSSAGNCLINLYSRSTSSTMSINHSLLESR